MGEFKKAYKDFERSVARLRRALLWSGGVLLFLGGLLFGLLIAGFLSR